MSGPVEQLTGGQHEHQVPSQGSARSGPWFPVPRLPTLSWLPSLSRWNMSASAMLTARAISNIPGTETCLKIGASSVMKALVAGWRSRRFLFAQVARPHRNHRLERFRVGHRLVLAAPAGAHTEMSVRPWVSITPSALVASVRLTMTRSSPIRRLWRSHRLGWGLHQLTYGSRQYISYKMKWTPSRHRLART